MKIGIDLGTSYSSVAVEVNGKIEMIRVATGAGAFGDSFSIPTAAYVDNGRILLGQAALNKRKLSPSCFKSEFKRDLGTTTPFILGGEEYLPEQLYTEFFLYFKKQAIEQTGEKIEKVYITHPANYGNNKKRLVEKAANNAGLLDVVLVDEPTAAAAGYSQKSRINEGDIILVYDLGGGTFDVAIIKKTANGYVHLTEPLGISMCGGVDFDRAIFDDIMSKLGQSGQFDMDRLLKEKRFTASLSEISIQIKHQLSQADSHTEPIAVGFDYFDYTITRQEFESFIDPFIASTCEKVKDILKNSGLVSSDIDRVLLVGGSSQVPLVRKMVQETLQKDISLDADPELAVCQGAVSIGVQSKPADNKMDEKVADSEVEEKQIKEDESKGKDSDGAEKVGEDGCILGIDMGEDEITVGVIAKKEEKVLFKIDTWDILTSMKVDGCTINEILNNLGIQHIKFGEMKLSSSEILENIFREIKKRSESYLRKSVCSAAVVIPVDLTHYQKSAFFDALEKNGLKMVKNVTKPAAAAAVYCYKNIEDMKILSLNFRKSEVEVAVCESGQGVLNIHGYLNVKTGKVSVTNMETVFEKVEQFIKKYDIDFYSSPYVVLINGNNVMPILLVNSTTTYIGMSLFKRFKRMPSKILSEGRDMMKALSVIDSAELLKLGRSGVLVIDSTYYDYTAEINGERYVIFEGPRNIPTKNIIAFSAGSTDSCRIKIYLSRSGSKEYLLCDEFVFDMLTFKAGMELEFTLDIDAFGRASMEVRNKAGNFSFNRSLKGSAVSRNETEVKEQQTPAFVRDAGTLKHEKSEDVDDKITQYPESIWKLMINVKLGTWPSDSDWIYYEDKDALFKIRKDGTHKTLLSNRKIWVVPIKIDEEWVYYLVDEGNAILEGGFGLYRIRKDGTGQTKISSEKIWADFNVYDQWIYFTTKSSLKKMRVDGTSISTLDSEHYSSIKVMDDWIYCTGETGVYRMHTDGTGKMSIFKGRVGGVSIQDNWIFYKDYGSGKGIYGIHMDGTGKYMICDDKVGNFNICNGWLYYKNLTDDKYYRVHIDSGSREVVM